MRSITLSQLRNTRLWLPWLKAGETIELRSRKRVIGRIVPDESIIEKPRISPQEPRTDP
jgi:antitoxin (DNA-binding transcriptional repressor) of toxin-antitoxin stability system